LKTLPLRLILTSIISYLCFCLCIGQTETPILHINKTSETIELDGRLDEEIWQIAEKANDFQIRYSPDTNKVILPTEAMMAYDDNYLYIAATCYDNQREEEYVAQSLKRDFSFRINDVFSIYIDAFGDKNSGLSFAVTPYGVQREGTIEKGGHKGVTTAWDGYWESKVYNDSLFWSLEIKIPFKTLNYSTKRIEWKVNFARNELKNNQLTTWSEVPRKINVAMLGHTGTLKWDEAPTKPNKKVSLIPYIISHVTKDIKNKPGDRAIFRKYFFGGDAKISISSSLKMDLAFNPDFSQVDADRQIINLDRFEVSLPEQRPFFLENSDMFSLLGNSRVSPVRTRRIGGADSSPVPIIGGLKLSGDIGRNWRIGVLNVHTGKDDGVYYNQNYLVASASRKFIKKSYVGVLTGFITNRQAFDGPKVEKEDYNFTGGVEYNYRRGSEFNSNAYFNAATTAEKLDEFIAYGFKGRYKTATRNYYIGIDVVGENYITDMGFVPRLIHRDTLGNIRRLGYAEFRTNGSRTFYFGKKANGTKRKLDNHGFYFGLDVYTDNLKFSKYQDHEGYFGWQITLSNTGTFKIEYNNSNPIFIHAFKLKGLDSFFAPGNYRQSSYRVEYQRGKKNKFNGTIGFEYGDKLSGMNMNTDVELTYRPTKRSAFSVNGSYNKLFDFDSRYGEAHIILVGAKTEFSFPKKIFWTNFLQFNNIDAQFSINSRLRWNYMPSSDLFLVVINNSSTMDNKNDMILQAKSWQVVLKMNHWFNVGEKIRKKGKKKETKDL
jgi:hypothetical protein